MDVSEIREVECEAGVIASIVLKPSLTFYSEALQPNHFTDPANAAIYYAVSTLATMRDDRVDAYRIMNLIQKKNGTQHYIKYLTLELLNEVFENAHTIAMGEPEVYKAAVDKVIDAAMRRSTFSKLKECEGMCFQSGIQDLEQKVYSALDSVMMSYSTTQEIPQYADIVDDMWQQIKDKQGDGFSGIPFKFRTLNEYVTIEPGELIIFGAEAKQGKSMMLLNCAVDLLRQDKSILYIDSELNTRMFTTRLLSHLTGIEFKRVRSGHYSEEEGKRIDEQIEWMKTRKFTHKYIPMFDSKTIYSTVKKVYHTQGIDVLIIDYFKSTGEQDAFATYQEMGKLTDLIKNTISGDMNIASIGAAQATSTGQLADSRKIGRNASTIIMIEDKTQAEMMADGSQCGNKKLRVVLNRNGPQMVNGEYIDVKFDGNLVLYEEAEQHQPQQPF